MVVTWGEVRLDITMCSAILMRIWLIGSMRVLAGPAGGIGAPGPGAAAGVGAAGAVGSAAAGVVGGAGGGPDGFAAAAGCCARWASRSCLVMRPPAPVPDTRVRSILFSRAILRTSGE